MSISKNILLSVFLVMVLSSRNGYSQEIPYNPVSYRIFTPFIINPAISGSKDFSSIDYSLSNYNKNKSHLFSGNFRIPRSSYKFYSSLSATQFSGFGGGFYAFNDKLANWRNSGIGLAASYHIKLNRDATSFLSFGLAGKALISKTTPFSENDSEESHFTPDADAGIYYYNPVFYAGLSATNMFNHAPYDSIRFSAAFKREFFLYTGIKIVLSKSGKLVLEPSLIIKSDESFSDDIVKMIKPALRIYAGNFCAGTYLNEPGKIPFFIQYKYSKVYIAAYFELPGESPFYKHPTRTEFALGVNLSAFKKGYNYKRNHW